MQTHDHQLRRRLYPWMGGLAGLVLVVAAAWAADFIPGDVNDDGVFDVLDPTVLRRELAGLEPGITQMCSTEFPATGQVTCWDSFGTVIPCSSTGRDGDFQGGAPLAYQDNGDGTITDLNTGLMWEKKSADGTIHDLDQTYTWANAVVVHVAGLNTASFAGHADWRVPNVKELQSIVNYETANPSVDPVFNSGCIRICAVTTCSCTASRGYWSSTSRADGPTTTWFVSFVNGFVNTDSPGNFNYVRAVRGGVSAGISSCGNGVCDSSERPRNCAADCCPPAPGVSLTHCAGSVVETCVFPNWVFEEDCSSSGAICTEVLAGVAICEVP